MSKEMREQMNKFNNLLIENNLQNEGVKDKIVGALFGLSALVSSCESITPEEKQRLKSEIEILAKQEQQDRKMADYYGTQVQQKQEMVRKLDEEVKNLETKLGILKKGKKPRYILELHFQEHKMEISIDRIRFDFEIPVDEEFYNESEVGKELGSGSRVFSFGHHGDITVTGKRIQQ
jgi:hypothetical protein